MYTKRPQKVIIPRDEALMILADLLPTFRECLDQAWQFVEQVFGDNAERRTAFSATTRANMLYDRMAQLVRQSLDGHARVAMSNRGRMLRLIIDGRLLIRFKKLDDALRTRNVRTKSQRLDYFQLWLPTLEEPKLTKLTFGYRLNEMATEIVGRYITCPKNWEENHWMAALDEAASDAMPLFMPGDRPDNDGNTGIVITPKRALPKKGSASA